MKKQFSFVLAIIVFAGLTPIFTLKAAELIDRVRGRILLQVESHGEAWYVNPKDSKRYYMADGAEAYNIMRNLGVGITDVDLARIKANKTFAKIHQGKIFLQVESHGEAYYINIDGSPYYLKDGEAAYSIMRQLGLGITNSDLDKITLSDADTPPLSIIDGGDSYDVKVSSSTCILERRMISESDTITNVRAIMRGTAKGPVGARVELPLVIWSDDKWFCGDWTYSPGALIAVGGTCTRQEGQPTSTEWTVDTGGEEQGAWLEGKLRSYNAKIYKQGALTAEKEYPVAYTCE
jgi:hypothetical protein